MYKFCCVIDAEGFYKTFVIVVSESGKFNDSQVEDYTLKEGEKLLDVNFPEGLVKAKWDGAAWIEGATDEEVEQAKDQKESDGGNLPGDSGLPSLEDRITAAENALLSLMLGGISNV